MKTEKIVSITMANAFILMLFGSFLSGCQKKTISKTGFYTNFSVQNRAPASFDEFSKLQDPKQVFIYCQLNELNPQKCYNLYINQKINETNKKNLQAPEYANVERQIKQLNNKLISLVLPQIKNSASNREEFCEKNSKFYLNRCLHQYVNKESLEIVNKLQNSQTPFNGHEYLYVQKQIENKMKALLVISEKNINDRKKKAL